MQSSHLYPDYVYDANPYEFLAEAYLAKANKTAAAAVLTEYMKRRRTSARGAQGAGRYPRRSWAIRKRRRPLWIGSTTSIQRTTRSLHRHLGDLWLEQKNYAGAIREYAAVVALHPLDMASAQFDLARAYFAAGQRDKAEDAVLASLEVAPGYRPAQKAAVTDQESLT